MFVIDAKDQTACVGCAARTFGS